MVDLAAKQPADERAGVEAIPLGEEVLERAPLRGGGRAVGGAPRMQSLRLRASLDSIGNGVVGDVHAALGREVGQLVQRPGSTRCRPACGIEAEEEDAG